MTAFEHRTTVTHDGHNHWKWRCPHCAAGRCHTWADAFAAAYWHARQSERMT